MLSATFSEKNFFRPWFYLYLNWVWNYKKNNFIAIDVNNFVIKRQINKDWCPKNRTGNETDKLVSPSGFMWLWFARMICHELGQAEPTVLITVLFKKNQWQLSPRLPSGREADPLMDYSLLPASRTSPMPINRHTGQATSYSMANSNPWFFTGIAALCDLQIQRSVPATPPPWRMCLFLQVLKVRRTPMEHFRHFRHFRH